jgi:hypothetical protein
MIKIIIRSLLYPWIILFTGFSIGFICNSEWFGHKYVLVERSINNIFFPIKYNAEIENHVREIGKLRIWAEVGCPEEFTVIEDVIKAEEFYWAIVKYKDKQGKEIKNVLSTRVRWKTWEYYYTIDEPLVSKK